MFGAISGLAASVGPVLGGFLIDARDWVWPAIHLHDSWQLIFFINVPIGVLGLVLALVLIPSRGRVSAETHIDLPGVALSSVRPLLSQPGADPEQLVALDVGAGARPVRLRGGGADRVRLLGAARRGAALRPAPAAPPRLRRGGDRHHDRRPGAERHGADVLDVHDRADGLHLAARRLAIFVMPLRRPRPGAAHRQGPRPHRTALAGSHRRRCCRRSASCALAHLSRTGRSPTSSGA